MKLCLPQANVHESDDEADIADADDDNVVKENSDGEDDESNEDDDNGGDDEMVDNEDILRIVNVPKTHDPLPFEEVKVDEWVLVDYEGEYFPGIALHKHEESRKVKVKCLEKPYGVNIPQTFESEVNHVYFSEQEIFKITIRPCVLKLKRGWKYGYNL